MSISEREQEALDCIERDLVGSGPELASKLAIFLRLTAGEEMPKRESISPVCPLSAATVAVMASQGSGASEGASASMSAVRASARRIVRRLSAGAVLRLLWLVAAIALIVVSLTVYRATGKEKCPGPGIAVCEQVPAHPGAGAGIPKQVLGQ